MMELRELSSQFEFGPTEKEVKLSHLKGKERGGKSE